MQNPEGKDPQAENETSREAAERILNEKRERKAEVSSEIKETLESQEDPLGDRLRKELVQGSIKIIEERTGHSLEFSQEQYSQIKIHIKERFASVMAPRAEEYIRRNSPKLEKQGIAKDTKGAAAIEVVESLGATNEVIKKDKELEKIYILLGSLEEFSRNEIPPAGRFAILEQLNQLSETDDLKKLRVEVFQKWTGKEPEVGSISLTNKSEELFKAESLTPHIEQIKGSLSAQEEATAQALGISKEDFAMLKELNYSFVEVTKKGGTAWEHFKNSLKGNTEPRILQPSGQEIFVTNLVSQLNTLRNNWENALYDQHKDSFQEKAKLELGAVFVSGVTDLDTPRLKQTYKSLRDDIYAHSHARILQETQEGEAIIEEAEESLRGKAGGLTQFAKKIATGEGAFNLSGDIAKDKDAIRRELKDNWDADISPEDFDKYVSESGMDYSKLSQKGPGRFYFFLRLIMNSIRETQRAASAV